jgi:hypothetical protein
MTAEPATSTVDASSLSLPLLAERIQHEREMRQLSERAIAHEAKLRKVYDRHERESRRLAERAVEKARAIQFREYERRLDELNHAHDAAVVAQASTVPRETYEARVAEVDRRLGLSETALTKLLASSAGRQGVQSWLAPNLGSIVAIVVGLVVIYLFVSGQA